MTIRIVTDSASDLSPKIAAAAGITVVPNYINYEGQSYLDQTEISRSEFYAHLPTMLHSPTTSSPGPEAYAQVYQRLAEEGATGILSVHVSQNWSAIYNAARVAAETIQSIPVRVADAGQVTLGLGFIAQAAAQAAHAGSTLGEVAVLVEDMARRTYTLAILDTLEFLRRGGRATRLQARMGAWLQIRPLLKLHLGEISMDPIRTRRKAFDQLVGWIQTHGPWEQLAVVHTCAAGFGEEVWERVQQFLPAGRDRLSVQATPVIGAHAGPGAFGLVAVMARSDPA